MRCFKFFPFLLALCTASKTLNGIEPSEAHLKMLYNSITPSSISQHLAFYELYPNTPLGILALHDAWRLISPDSLPYIAPLARESLSSNTISSLTALVNKNEDQNLPIFDESALKLLDSISCSLPHSKLRGHSIWTESEMILLPLEEIDLARALLVSQLGSDKNKIRAYEAMIDLMALQIAATFPTAATPEKKIHLINQFVFEKMEFRYPPLSIY